MDLSRAAEYPRQPLLRKSPLKAVLCQLRFPKRLGGLQGQEMRPVAEALAEEYPVTNEDEIREVSFHIIGGAGQVLPSEAEKAYRFLTDNEDWTATFTSEWVALETTAYSGFEDFEQRWRKLCTVAQKILDLKQETRLGFRFVNEVKLETDGALGELKSLLSPEVLGALSMTDNAGSLTRSWQELRLKLSEDAGCTMQHGYVQNPQGESVYVLDFDSYREGRRPLEIEDQIATMAALNHRVFGWFKASVTPETFAGFEPEEESN